MNTYETIFILKPELNDEDVRKTINKIEECIRQKGEIISTENWGKKKLAYEVRKEKKGTYILIRFTGKGGLIADIEKNYRYDDNIIKFITVKLDKKEVEFLKKQTLAGVSKEKPSEGSKTE